MVTYDSAEMYEREKNVTFHAGRIRAWNPANTATSAVGYGELDSALNSFATFITPMRDNYALALDNFAKMFHSVGAAFDDLDARMAAQLNQSRVAPVGTLPSNNGSKSAMTVSGGANQFGAQPVYGPGANYSGQVQAQAQRGQYWFTTPKQNHLRSASGSPYGVDDVREAFPDVNDTEALRGVPVLNCAVEIARETGRPLHEIAAAVVYDKVPQIEDRIPMFLVDKLPKDVAATFIDSAATAGVVNPKGVTVDGDGRLWFVAQDGKLVPAVGPTNATIQVLSDQGIDSVLARVIKPLEGLPPFLSGVPIDPKFGVAPGSMVSLAELTPEDQITLRQIAADSGVADSEQLLGVGTNSDGDLVGATKEGLVPLRMLGIQRAGDMFGAAAETAPGASIGRVSSGALNGVIQADTPEASARITGGVGSGFSARFSTHGLGMGSETIAGSEESSALSGGSETNEGPAQRTGMTNAAMRAPGFSGGMPKLNTALGAPNAGDVPGSTLPAKALFGPGRVTDFLPDGSLPGDVTTSPETTASETLRAEFGPRIVRGSGLASGHLETVELGSDSDTELGDSVDGSVQRLVAKSVLQSGAVEAPQSYEFGLEPESDEATVISRSDRMAYLETLGIDVDELQQFAGPQGAAIDAGPAAVDSELTELLAQLREGVGAPVAADFMVEDSDFGRTAASLIDGFRVSLDTMQESLGAITGDEARRLLNEI